MAESYYNTYYEYGDKQYHNIACYSKANEGISDVTKNEFFENVAHAIVRMERHNGYEVTRVVFEGEPLKWCITDIEFSDTVLITFTSCYTGEVVHSISAPW